MGLNDTSLWVIYAVSQARAAIKKYGNKWNVKPGPSGMGAFTDIIAGFHNAASGSLVAGRGNCVFVDGHVAGVAREDSFGYAGPK